MGVRTRVRPYLDGISLTPRSHSMRFLETRRSQDGDGRRHNVAFRPADSTRDAGCGKLRRRRRFSGPKRKRRPTGAALIGSAAGRSGAGVDFHFFLAAIFVDLQRLGAPVNDLGVDNDLDDALH